MGVWSNVYLYQPVNPPGLSRRLLRSGGLEALMPKFETIASQIGLSHYDGGDVGKGFYDSFCEDTVLSEVRDSSFESLLDECKRLPRSRWVSANFEANDFAWIDQINTSMALHPDIAGDYSVYGVSLVVGQIRIEDEEGGILFHSDSMLYFYGDSSPNDGQAYADLLLQCELVQQFLKRIDNTTGPDVWKSALVVS